MIAMFEVKNVPEGLQINYTKKGKQIGYAIVEVWSSFVFLKWIEIDENYRCKSNASNLLIYIFNHVMKAEHALHLTAVDEQAHYFFYKFFTAHGVDRDDLENYIKETDSGFKFTIPKNEISTILRNSKENAQEKEPNASASILFRL